MVTLDRFRVTVRLETKKPGPPEGSNVWLQFGPRQRESPTIFGGMVWRVDSTGLITLLLSLTTREFHNLKSLVSALLSGETVPVQPPRPMPSGPRLEPQATAPATPVPPRPESPTVNLAQEAEALAARGDYEGAWRLYYRALQATPEDVSLWYGLGVTLSHLNKRKEAEEAFQYVVRHDRPDSEEVRLARRWLLDAGVLAESATLTGVADAVGDAREDKEAAKGKATRDASEPGRAPVQPPRSKPSEPSPAQQAEARATPVPRRPESSNVNLAQQAEARATPVPRRPESSNVNLAQQAEALAARGDYEGAWRLYYRALQATPEDVSLWYGLGVTASHLNKRKEAEEVRHDRPDSEEVRLAGVAHPVGDAREDKEAAKGKATRRASEPGRAPVQPPRSKPPEPSPARQAEARTTPVPRRPESSNVNLARQAEALAARGDSQRKETEEALPHMAPRGQPDSKEARPTQRALISAGAMAELAALGRVTEPVVDVRGDKAVKGRATRRASEPGRAPVQPPRSKPPEPSPARQVEARVTRRDYEGGPDRSASRYRIDGEGFDNRMTEGSMTKDERERALVALIKEGYTMPPTRTQLIAKVMEMRTKGDKERSKASKKTRGRTRF